MTVVSVGCVYFAKSLSFASVYYYYYYYYYYLYMLRVRHL